MKKDRVVLSSEILNAFLESSVHSGQWDGEWVRSNKPGHTKETLEVPHPASGRETAVYMLLARLAGAMDAEAGLAVLARLEDLVVEDEADPHYGCMRWFAEETQVWDTNAAFFTLMPFLVLQAVDAESLSAAEWDWVGVICRKTLPWFVKEAAEPHFYYPNKVISDGAILWGVGHFLGDEEVCAQASAFVGEWVTYTRERGWGWGENISLGYIPVMLVAMKFLIRTGEGQAWVKEMAGLEAELMEIVRFCDGLECCPSIRSYQFDGKAEVDSSLWSLVAHPDYPPLRTASMPELPWKTLLMMLLYHEGLAKSEYVPPEVPREKQFRIFEEQLAYSWAGKGIRLGSCSRFPVMPGHYQHEHWGLGWQSFPVSVIFEDAGVARMQWRTEKAGTVNTHPTSGKKGIYRNYRMSDGNDVAAVVTHATQKGPSALVVRSIKNWVSLEGRGLSDEWWFPWKTGQLRRHGDWWIFKQGDCVLALKALSVYEASADGEAWRPAEALVSEDQDGIRLTVPLLKETAECRVCERVEVAWAIRALDAEESEDVDRILASITLSDRRSFEYDLPRVDDAYVREVRMEENSRELNLRVDYHRDLWD
jgi:hypothetical protein